MVSRYGDFVLYRPPVKGVTLLLWGGPVALLLSRHLPAGQLPAPARPNAWLMPTSRWLPEDAQRAEALLKEIESK
jgi:cytochrome c-type biogenesis protein CcmH